MRIFAIRFFLSLPTRLNAIVRLLLITIIFSPFRSFVRSFTDRPAFDSLLRLISGHDRPAASE